MAPLIKEWSIYLKTSDALGLAQEMVCRFTVKTADNDDPWGHFIRLIIIGPVIIITRNHVIPQISPRGSCRSRVTNKKVRKKTMITVLKECERLLEDYSELLKRHKYLKKRLTNIQAKLNLPPDTSAIAKQEQSKLDTIHERIKALQSDPWLDQLFSYAQNEQQVEEIKRLMQKWGRSSYDSVAHCIVDHANRHGFSEDKLKYLRKAGHFKKKRARKAYPEFGVVRWNKGNNEYLIEREGQIVSYCINC